MTQPNDPRKVAPGEPGNHRSHRRVDRPQHKIAATYDRGDLVETPRQGQERISTHRSGS